MITAPTQISNCQVWLDASDTTSLFQLSGGAAALNNDPVGLWQNKVSPLTGHFVSSSTARPTYNTALSCLVFNGVNSTMAAGVTMDYFPKTIFIVLAVNSPVSQSTILGQWYSLSGLAPVIHAHYSGTPVNNYASNIHTPSRQCQVGYRPYNIFDVFTHKNNGGNIQNFINGVGSNIVADSIAATPALTGMRLGVLASAGTGNANSGSGGYFNGSIAEVIVYNKALSNAEQEDVTYYLTRKWSFLNAIPRQVYAIQNGNWSNSTTWSTSADPAPWNFPLPSDIVYCANNVVTLDANVNVAELTNTNFYPGGDTSIRNLSGGYFFAGSTFSPSITSVIFRPAKNNTGVIFAENSTFSYTGQLTAHNLENFSTNSIGTISNILILSGCAFNFTGNATPRPGSTTVTSQNGICIHVFGGSNTININNSNLIAPPPGTSSTTSRIPLRVNAGSLNTNPRLSSFTPGSFIDSNVINIQNTFIRGGGSSANTFSPGVQVQCLSAGNVLNITNCTLVGGDSSAVTTGVSPALEFPHSGGQLVLSACNLTGGTQAADRNPAVRFGQVGRSNNFNVSAINCTINGGLLSPGIYVASTASNGSLRFQDCNLRANIGQSVRSDEASTNINIENAQIVASNIANCIQIVSTTTRPVSVSGNTNIINAPNGRQAIYAPRYQVFPSASATYTRQAVNGYDSYVDYWTPDVTFTYPASSDVVLNTTYSNNALTGSMALPSPSAVYLNCPVGSTTTTIFQITTGSRYLITSNPFNTNFTLVGASNNTPGTIFTATSAITLTTPITAYNNNTGRVTPLGTSTPPTVDSFWNKALSELTLPNNTVGGKLKNVVTTQQLSSIYTGLIYTAPGSF